MNLNDRDRDRFTTSREGAELIREWAATNGGRIASAYVYEAMPMWTRLTRRQTARALQMSGLYPVRMPHNRVVWVSSRPRPWEQVRELGRVPTPRTERCHSCGSRYELPSKAPDWP